MVNFGQPVKQKTQERKDNPEKVFRFDDNLKLKIIDARPHRWMIWDILTVMFLAIITGVLLGWRFDKPEISTTPQYCIWISHCEKTDQWDVCLSQRSDPQHRWENVSADKCKIVLQTLTPEGSNINTRVRIPWDQ